MDFEPDKVEEFISFFHSIKDRIADTPGCNHVELCKDSKLDHVYFTFSRWDSEESLEAYRESALFENVWAQTKVLFGGKPLAYSLLQQ